jgi:hypothetical protein
MCLQKLVNELSAFIAMVEAQQPMGCKTWNDDEFDCDPPDSDSWSTLVVILALVPFHLPPLAPHVTCQDLGYNF